MCLFCHTFCSSPWAFCLVDPVEKKQVTAYVDLLPGRPAASMASSHFPQIPKSSSFSPSSASLFFSPALPSCLFLFSFSINLHPYPPDCTFLQYFRSPFPFNRPNFLSDSNCAHPHVYLPTHTSASVSHLCIYPPSPVCLSLRHTYIS
ncbi:unnamed protein product [Protopolystoma xenopodis]|uniref:Uncharacterized protein n=1 Tax=Protopolystoma xenopodis TaxID=117903 RepID=A0A448XDV4_9PLAT|nr:unnamed protein product [Protopolystoma xenopodis]